MPRKLTIAPTTGHRQVLAASDKPRVARDENVIYGYVVAQEGNFKSQGRGAFDLKALKSIVTLMNKNGPKGTRSRFKHPDLSSDALGSFLGRAKNPRLDTVKLKRDGELVLLHAVRADLHISRTAFKSPNGNLGEYILDLAEDDSDAFSSSLVLYADEEQQIDPKTKGPLLDADGNPEPPLWRPTRVTASDVVDTGDAVDGFLSGSSLAVEDMPDGVVRQAAALLDKKFAGCDRETIETRLAAFAARYLDRKFGEKGAPPQSAGDAHEGDVLTVEEAERRLAILG